MNIDICKLELKNIHLNTRDSEKIRGYLGNKYKELDILHNHQGDKFIYRYPKVQYKVIKNDLMIIGINEACKEVSKIGLLDDEVKIEDRNINIYEKDISIKTQGFGLNNDYITYRFISPWVALNQKNIKQYRNSNDIEKEEILKKILIGNIISMSKGINYTVEGEIKCWINLKKIDVNIKNIKHTAFVGEFKVNFRIPDYLGIGKNVSKGFGTIKRMG